MASINSSMKFSSFLLFLTIVHFLVWTCSLKIVILTVSGIWSNVNLQSRWIEWLLYSDDSGLKNIRSMTEFESCWSSEYLVGTWLVGQDNSKYKEFATSIRVFLWIEWYRKLGSQLSSLILKSPVIIRILLILTSVFLRYFKTTWNKSEYILIKKYTKLQLKNKIQEMSLWLKMSFCNKRQRKDSLMLIYVMILEELSIFEGFLEKIVQLG